MIIRYIIIKIKWSINFWFKIVNIPDLNGEKAISLYSKGDKIVTSVRL